MPDILTSEQRHKCMSHVRNKDTKPELEVRKALWRLGFRYRLYDKKLPGHPDLVFPKYKSVLFVNGCFWHGHQNCKKASLPKTNGDFWASKIKSNMSRDAQNKELLEAYGWKVIVVWECMLSKREINNTIAKIVEELSQKRKLAI